MPNQSSNATGAAPDTLGPVLKALADPTRRVVVERLSHGPATAGSLAEPFDMALPSFLQHMEMLEKSGLVRSEKHGRVRTYHLSPEPLRAAEHWMTAQRAIWETRLNQLDSYLDNLHRARQANPPKNS
jgi:DNA-binding transcriptional ArsR family regulator